MSSFLNDDKGQVHTIEAVIAAVILLSVLTIVVQTTSVTPLTSSFTNQHVKFELQNMAQDILNSLDNMPTDPTKSYSPSKLEKSIVDWMMGYPDDFTPALPGCMVCTWSGVKYVDPTLTYQRDPTTPFEDALTFAFAQNGIAYNVELRFPNAIGDVKCAKMIWNGDPSDDCVTVSKIIALYDADPAAAIGPGEIPTAPEYDEFGLIPDVSAETRLHNTVEVRLTMWVM